MPSRVLCSTDQPSDDEENRIHQDEEEDSGTDSYEDTATGSQQQHSPQPRRKKHRRQVPINEPRIRKKKQRGSRSPSSEANEVRQRRPLSNSFQQNRHQQRLDNTMGKGSKQRLKRKSQASDDDETVDRDTIQQDQQLRDLQLENLRLKKRQKYLSKLGAKSRASGANQSAMSREVTKVTKADLWSLKKFIYNDEQLYKVTKFVLNRLGNLVDFGGLSDEERADAEEQWIAQHADCVRKALNEQRNYTMSELRSLVLTFYDDNEEDLLPTVEQMKDIVMRKKFSGAGKATMEAKLDVYWDRLFPKIAGNSLWSSNKKYYQCMTVATCTSKIEGVDPIPCAHHSTEAIFLGLWENYFPKWSYEALQKRAGKDIDPEHKDMKTLGYVNNICGRKRYGGWTKIGKQRIHDIGVEIKENREKKFATIRPIEEACLARLRGKYNRDTIDSKKKKPKSKKGGAYDSEPEDSDEEVWFG